MIGASRWSLSDHLLGVPVLLNEIDVLQRILAPTANNAENKIKKVTKPVLVFMICVLQSESEDQVALDRYLPLGRVSDW